MEIIYSLYKTNIKHKIFIFIYFKITFNLSLIYLAYLDILYFLPVSINAFILASGVSCGKSHPVLKIKLG